jgi:hypothetical protein
LTTNIQSSAPSKFPGRLTPPACLSGTLLSISCSYTAAHPSQPRGWKKCPLRLGDRKEIPCSPRNGTARFASNEFCSRILRLMTILRLPPSDAN